MPSLLPMSSRALFEAVPVAFGAVAALALCVGACGASGSSAAGFGAGGDDAGGGVSPPVDAGAVETPDAPLAATPAATVYQGNPLCNASPATSCCYPDALSLCAPSACLPLSDGGAADGGSGYASQVVVYGCHLAPVAATAEPANVASDAMASAAAAQVAPACTPAGPGLDGALCHDPDDCAPGYECVGSPGACRHYCCEGNTACRADQFCDIQQTAGSATMNVPVCMPVRQCELLLDQTCPSGQTCAVVREDGSVSCLAIGSASVGQSCETEHCGAGLVCLGATARSCYALCQMTGPSQCPSGQSCKGGPPLFVDPGVGVCQ